MVKGADQIDARAIAEYYDVSVDKGCVIVNVVSRGPADALE
jgi:hypothetical protein